MAAAALPPRPIPGGIAGPGLITEVFVGKFGDHLPLYRLEDILARYGVYLSRSTLCDWMKAVAYLFRPLYELQRQRILQSSVMWTDDFVEDRTERGRKLRMLVVIDEFTRESLAIEVAWSFTAERVIEVLQYLFAVRGAPEHLRSDNGPEFVAQAVTRWLDRAGVKTLFIAKGSPWENGYVESFNSRLRDELLDRELFLSLADARWVVDRWRLDYNHHRPHSSLDYQTPAAFAARGAASAPELLSATPQATPPLQQHRGSLTPDPLIQAGT